MKVLCYTWTLHQLNMLLFFYQARHFSLKGTSSSKDGTTQKEQSALVNSGEKSSLWLEYSSKDTCHIESRTSMETSIGCYMRPCRQNPHCFEDFCDRPPWQQTRDPTDNALKIASHPYFFRHTHSVIPMNFPVKQKTTLISQSSAMIWRPYFILGVNVSKKKKLLVIIS